MKFGINQIIIGHIKTLRKPSAERVSKRDIFIFYIFPIGCALLSLRQDLDIGRDFYNVSITFFGIFIGLLLNIQVAIFGIFLRKRKDSTDSLLNEIYANNENERNILLGELNTNVTYIITISCIACIVFVFLFALNYCGKWSAFISIIIYIHFIMNLFMVVKRTYALFYREYKVDT